ncbi:DUF998 domain-containing protein [Glycomyces halotolerans]
MVVLHATSGLDPAFDVISVTLYSPLGWLLPVSLGLFAVGGGAFGLVARASRAPGWVAVLLFAWSGCLLLVALFPTDPPSASDFSVVHFVHRYAAFAAFCVMAGLGIGFGRWLGGVSWCGTVAAVCGWSALAALSVTAVPYVLEFAGAQAPGWTAAVGLNQRLTVGSELVALAVLGLWLRRDVSVPSERPVRSEPAPVL